MSGPYESERQAADAARHIYDSPPGTGAWGNGNHRLMEDACTAAGVTLGAYDHRILLWLAGWEPSTCAVVAGLIRRAARPAGKPDADPRVIVAREVLAWYDHGQWAEAGAIAVVGHLAAALRLLLDVVAEAQAGQRAAGQLAAIRAVLARFDWSRFDRQLALERIDQIVNGGDQ